MAKSLRSKVKKRFRTAKRQRVEAVVENKRRANVNTALTNKIAGIAPDVKKSVNMFLHPEHPDAEIPQYSVETKIDFRAAKLPMAGYCFRGNRRKYEGAEAEARMEKIKKDHPQVRVLAGAGLKEQAARDEEEKRAEESAKENAMTDVGEDDNDGFLEVTMDDIDESLVEADNKRVPIVRQAKKAPRVRGQVNKKQKSKKKV